MPIVKLNNSFSQIRVHGKNKTIIHLQEEIRVDTLTIYLEFSARIIIIFLIILGLAYLLILIGNSIKNNSKD